jgi:hypothetical protein
MQTAQVQVPQLPPFVDKAALAAAATPFYVTAAEDDSYQGKAQYRLAITDENGAEPAALTLGAGGSRDSVVGLIRAALANGADGVGPFVLTAFPTTFGKPGYALANYTAPAAKGKK